METLDLTRRLQKRILLVCLLTVPVWGVVVLLLRLPEEERLSAFLCVPALVLQMGLTLLGLTVLCGHVLLTSEGIVVTKGQDRREYRWADYCHAYALHGRKTQFLLFSRASLDKEGQLAAYRTCRQQRRSLHPFREAEGLLLFDPMLAEKEILQRLPPHIEVVPPERCARL